MSEKNLIMIILIKICDVEGRKRWTRSHEDRTP